MEINVREMTFFSVNWCSLVLGWQRVYSSGAGAEGGIVLSHRGSARREIRMSPPSFVGLVCQTLLRQTILLTHTCP